MATPDGNAIVVGGVGGNADVVIGTPGYTRQGWSGSVGEEISYWRRRATTAESRCESLEAELSALRGRPTP